MSLNENLFKIAIVISEIKELQEEKRRCESDFDLSHSESALAAHCLSEIETINTEIEKCVSVLKETISNM